MGIHGLSKVIAENAPAAKQLTKYENLFSRKIAIDASTSIYQFLVAVRTGDGTNLTASDGSTTSHLMGMFHRTIRMVNSGIKPVYVFDGKPPTLKSGELAKRRERRQLAEERMQEAEDKGITADVNKYQRQLVKVTPQHNEECKRLLKLMGIPYINAPCEAEAQCAVLAKEGKVWGTASEDMDTLTFGSPVLVRNMTVSEKLSENVEILELKSVLEGMDLTHDQFVDMCILLGCDYCESIKGIGPVKAFALIKEHKCIENIIEAIDKEKYVIPQNWPFEDVRKLFVSPVAMDVETGVVDMDIKWSEPNIDGLVEFLCEEKGFNEERVRNSCAKLSAKVNAKQQGRMDSFFKKVKPTNDFNNPLKRKLAEEEKAKAGAEAKSSKNGKAEKTAKTAKTAAPRKPRK
ncbi:PIN domain-like protein [Ramicandelaber brevisporus]|nr:PIN domain-like protein [Ramicandelaber brevisporus]